MSSEEKYDNNPLSVILRLSTDRQQMAKNAAAHGDLDMFKCVLKTIKFAQEHITEMEQNGNLQTFMDECEFLPIEGTKS